MFHAQDGHVPPVVLITLLHVHISGELLPQNKSTKCSVDFLLNAGLIDVSPDIGKGCGWQTTDRGRAHVVQLCQHPFPIPMEGWMNPITRQALT